MIFMLEKSKIELIMELPSFLKELTNDKDTPSLEYASEIFSMLESYSMSKKETLLFLGDTASKVFIIKKGIIKASIIDENGDLHVTRFVAENDIITSMLSFVNQEPSSLQIDCVEAGEVLCFKYEDFQYMNKLYPGIGPSFHRLMLKRYDEMLDEKCRMISRDATTRYIKFAERYPTIIDRLPLKDIASFLGIRQQSLSRLRGKMNS